MCCGKKIETNIQPEDWWKNLQVDGLRVHFRDELTALEFINRDIGIVPMPQLAVYLALRERWEAVELKEL
jgi:hypothetical protein